LQIVKGSTLAEVEPFLNWIASGAGGLLPVYRNLREKASLSNPRDIIPTTGGEVKMEELMKYLGYVLVFVAGVTAVVKIVTKQWWWDMLKKK